MGFWIIFSICVVEIVIIFVSFWHNGVLVVEVQDWKELANRAKACADDSMEFLQAADEKNAELIEENRKLVEANKELSEVVEKH